MEECLKCKELEAEVAALRDKVADYEYPLRENNWVKVRQEVWDAKEAKLEHVRAIAKKANEGDQYGSTCAWAIHDILEALEGKQDG